MVGFKPFIHNVGINVWQVCYVNENNYLCARTYKGRHAEQFAKEDLEKMLNLVAENAMKKSYPHSYPQFLGSYPQFYPSYPQWKF